MAKFKTIITTAGAAKIAAVLAGTASIVLDNTAKMAVGDGGGTLPTPNPAQTKLVREVHRAPINRASIDTSDPKNIVAELVIPPATGGFWVREMALYDAEGTLLAVGNMAETYKPSLSEGAGRKMVIRMVIAVSEVSAITITMDTTTVMATQDYVDSEIDKHAKSRNHPDATLTAKGFTQLSSSTTSTSETLAATPKAVKAVMDEAKLKAPLASPALTGTPTAPTAAAGNNSQQLANTQFVMTAIAALVNSSPGALDTLSELAAALGNDPNFATTMLNALAAKAPLASPALTGKPTAPTAPQASNDTQLATTEFVTRAVAPAVLMRGGIPASSNLNNFGPTSDYIGVWGQSSISATAADIANGYPTAERGVLEVIPGGRNNGTQRYTTDGGRIFIRWLNAAWNAASPSWSDWIEIGGLSSTTVLPASVTTLSDYAAFAQNKTYILSGVRTDSPVGLSVGQNNAILMSLRRTGGAIMGLAQLMFTGAGIYERRGQPDAATNWTSVTWYPGGDAYGWRPIGADAMAAIGIGVANQTPADPFDWQQVDFVSEQVRLATVGNFANAPNGFSYAATTVVMIKCVSNQAGRLVLRVTSNAAGTSNRAEYNVVMTGVKGSRTITVTQIYNSDSSTVIPLTNGGLGATTPEGGRKSLGFEDMGIGIPSQIGISGFDWQQADFVTGQKYLVNVTGWLNAPAAMKNPAGDVVSIECVLARADANRFVLSVTSQSTTLMYKYDYTVVVAGAKGARVFIVTQNFNSDPTTVVPLANGGTGSPTPAGALANLGGAPLASPALTGIPTAPTPAQTVNNTQIATTAFVKVAIAAIVNSSPAALDTLKELADALGNDANFATTMTNALAGKQPKDNTLTNLSGKDVAGLLAYLGLTNAMMGDWCKLAGFVANNKAQPYMRHADSKADVLLATLDNLLTKQDKDQTLTDLSGKDALGLRNHLLLKGASIRDVGNGTGQIPDMSFWGSPSGGINMPNGAQLRHGEVTLAGAKTFDTPFANSCFAIVFGTQYGSNNWVFSPGYKQGTLTKSGFEFVHMCYSGVTTPQVAGERVKYLAIGY